MSGLIEILWFNITFLLSDIKNLFTWFLSIVNESTSPICQYHIILLVYMVRQSAGLGGGGGGELATLIISL